eukprot:4917527-Alexandrium_andersonii.AAC.1
MVGDADVPQHCWQDPTTTWQKKHALALSQLVLRWTALWLSSKARDLLHGKFEVRHNRHPTKGRPPA